MLTMDGRFHTTIQLYSTIYFHSFGLSGQDNFHAIKREEGENVFIYALTVGYITSTILLLSGLRCVRIFSAELPHLLLLVLFITPTYSNGNEKLMNLPRIKYR